MANTRAYSTLPFVDPADVGRTLGRLVAESDMTQEQLAHAADMKQEAISRAIRTGRGISSEKWKDLARALGVEVETIFGVQKIPPPEKTLSAV